MNVQTVEAKTRKTLTGRVSSNSMDKTIVVVIERKVKHPLYGKYIRRFSKMYAHDENNTCKVGDLVEIKQTRPLSKKKFWQVVQVLDHTEK